MTTPQTADEQAREFVARVIDEYVDKRVAYYSRTDLLHTLLGKDHLMFALKGATSAADWLNEALNAHESSSEETMMGNAWQQILTDLSQSVGAGDLMVEKDGVLWIVEMKSQPNTLNALSKPQTIRGLKAKVLQQERVRTPGRRGVNAMIGVLRGPSIDRLERFRGTGENADIDSFQYTYMVGQPFRQWLTGMANPAALVANWRDAGQRIGRARAVGKARLLKELEDFLNSRGLALDIASIIEVTAPSAAASSGAPVDSQ